MKVELQPDRVRLVTNQQFVPGWVRSMLGIEGFRQTQGLDWEFKGPALDEKATWLTEALARGGIEHQRNEATERAETARRRLRASTDENRALGRRLKQGDLAHRAAGDIHRFVAQRLPRQMRAHQIKAAVHLGCLDHAANFSVPGAGKSAVVLSVFEYLRTEGKIDTLFIVGPRACFEPWESEFENTLGRQPNSHRLSGGDRRSRRRWYPMRHDRRRPDLVLTTYQTLAQDADLAERLLERIGTSVFFVVDEGHYMKQDGGVWAKAVIRTSRHAAKRCVLTGTPFPRTYGDGLTLFRVLYPDGEVVTPRQRIQIRQAGEKGDHDTARACLKPAIDGLFYRVRKRDLALTSQVFEPPRRVAMRPLERELYECITKRISELEATGWHYETETLLRLRKGRQIRKRQATSFAALLGSAIEEVEYDEDLLGGADAYLRDALRAYAETEVPGKISALMEELASPKAKGEKVVVWSYFVGTLERIQEECDRQDIRGKTIWGGTPTGDDAGDTGRAAIIQEFTDPKSGLDVLIANPAACAESISLHKTCGHAIYYDLSYNCAQYLQSLDRIHRVGGSEDRTARYSFLMYEDTFEGEILNNLLGKAQRMADIVDVDFPLALQALPEFTEMM